MDTSTERIGSVCLAHRTTEGVTTDVAFDVAIGPVALPMMVPMGLHALMRPSDQIVALPMADLSKLPFVGPEANVYGHTAIRGA